MVIEITCSVTEISSTDCRSKKFDFQLISTTVFALSADRGTSFTNGHDSTLQKLLLASASAPGNKSKDDNSNLSLLIDASSFSASLDCIMALPGLSLKSLLGVECLSRDVVIPYAAQETQLKEAEPSSIMEYKEFMEVPLDVLQQATSCGTQVVRKPLLISSKLPEHMNRHTWRLEVGDGFNAKGACLTIH